MDCTRFEDLLFESLGARLSAGDQERLRAHARSCSRCRDLAAAMAEDSRDVVEVPSNLLAGVVALTTGSSCERAQLLAADGADGPLGAEGNLLSAHLGACNDCARIARALVQLRHELPTLAEMEPDGRFVAEVMAATIGAARPRPLPWRERMRMLWEGAVQRPRFAFEAAYAGVFVFFLLFGLPSRSVTELPARAFDGIRQESVRVELAVSSGIDGLLEVGRSSWAQSMRQVTAYFEEADGGGASSPVEGKFRSWAAATRELAVSVWDRIVVPFAENLRALWRSPDDNGSEAPDDEQDRRPRL